MKVGPLRCVGVVLVVVVIVPPQTPLIHLPMLLPSVCGENKDEKIYGNVRFSYKGIAFYFFIIFR